jgi:hypothetical protein
VSDPNALIVFNALLDITLANADKLLPFVVKDEADRKRAELYLAVLTHGLKALQREMVEVIGAIEDPSTINLDELFMDDFDGALARLRAERAPAPEPAPES